jgi:ATP phosphoribosyltransferase
LHADDNTSIFTLYEQGRDNHLLTIAIQKSGRLHEKTMELFRESGLRIDNGGREKLKAEVNNFPLAILYLRDDDIPASVADGVADAGIVGANVVAEKNRHVNIRTELDFARCRLSLAVPKNRAYAGPHSLTGSKIATSYPNILRKYLEQEKISATIHEINGSVEIAPGIGMADAIFDIVSTGSTLAANALREVTTVMHSQAVLINNNDLSNEKEKLLQDLQFRWRTVNAARRHKYILLNAPNDRLGEISDLLPGMKSPTVVPLAEAGWSSLHSVIQEDDFWEVIDKLQAAGAEGILVIPIEKMIH